MPEIIRPRSQIYRQRLRGPPPVIAPSRRALLASVSSWAIALSIIGTSSAAPLYQGSPNVTVTSITPSITASRSGTLQTPAFIHVSASAVTAVGSSNPYENLEYTWHFGDASGAETFLSPYLGTTVNANTAQTGPEAAYVYRNPGTYTITLTCRGKNGSGFTTAAATLDVTVSAFSPTGGDYYFDAVSGSDSNAGTQAAPFKTTVKFNSLVGTANNMRFNFMRGQTFTGAALDITRATFNGLRIDAYGTGANPIIVASSSSSNGAINFSPGHGANNVTQQDAVVSNINFQNASGVGGGVIVAIGTASPSSGTGLVDTDIYFDNCSASDPNNNGGNCVQIQTVAAGPPAQTFNNMGFWGGSYTLSTTGTNGGTGILGGAHQYCFFVGVNVSGNGASRPSRNHHFYMHTGLNLLCRWNVCGLSGTSSSNYSRLYSFRLAYSPPADLGTDGTAFYGQYFCISDNHCFGTQYAMICGANNNNNPATSRVKQFVVERILFDNLPAGGGSGVFTATCAETLTVRDCNVWGCGAAGGEMWFNPNGVNADAIFLRAHIYRNQVYDTIGMGGIVYVGVAWGSGGPFPQVVTDNKFYSTSSSVRLENIVSSSWTTANRSLIAICITPQMQLIICSTITLDKL